MATPSTRLALAWGAVLVASAIGFGACDDDGQPTTTPTGAVESPTATAEPTAAPEPPSTPEATDEPAFMGGQEPVEGSLGLRSGVPPVPLLVDVRVGRHEGFDRIVFEFEGAPPDYRVEYVATPVDCGTGEPSFMVVGRAFFLTVRFTPAQAHDDAGMTTIDALELTPRFDAIAAARLTCDFEADVTWALLLNERVDFRVFELEDPLRLVIDLAQP